jgi:hypothetical protein
MSMIIVTNTLLARSRVYSVEERLATGWVEGIRFPEGQDFYFLHSVHAVLPSFLSSEYKVAILPRGKAAGAWSWLLTSIYLVQRSRMLGHIPPLPINLGKGQLSV